MKKCKCDGWSWKVNVVKLGGVFLARQAVKREIAQRDILEGDSRKQEGWHVKEGGEH